MMTTFVLRKLSNGVVCPDGDSNFPLRCEEWGDIDIDNQCPGVAKAAGLQHDDIVVDVGAFVGDTAVGFARYGCEVHAFEPFLDSFVCLLYNTRNFPKVHCYHGPAGDAERVKLVYESPGPNYGMRSVDETTAPDCITTLRIDDLQLPSCKLMKVDCEGSEIAALQGAKRTIAKYRPFLFVESYKEALARRGHTQDDLDNFLKSLGYSIEQWGNAPRWDIFCRPL